VNNPLFSIIIPVRTQTDYLKENLRKLGIKVDFPSFRSSLLESILSRGDRNLSKAIFAAWKKGAKFDAWKESFVYDHWEQAFIENSIDPNFFAHRSRNIEEVFPWDHINIGVKKEFILLEYERSRINKTSVDCRDECLGCGIQSNFQIDCSKIRSVVVEK